MESLAHLSFYAHMVDGELHSIANELLRMKGETELLKAMVERAQETHGGPIEYFEQVKELASRAREGVGNALWSIEHLRRMRKRGSPELKEVDLVRTVLKPVFMKETERARGTRIRFSESLGPLAGRRVLVDADLLQEALSQLIQNAIRATMEKARGAGGKVSLIGNTSEKNVIIRIQDNGIGMSPEVSRRAFEPFFTTREDGTGLGLFFARAAVREMGGTLRVDRSFTGMGTRMIVTIPIRV